VLLVALPVVYRLTRELNQRYNVPEIVPAGVSVDLDVVACQEHEDAMVTAEPEATGIEPVAALPPANPEPTSVAQPPDAS